jgi:DNA-binding PadR family transcriptional regulator
MTHEPLSSPLTPAVFYILLALARGERHGYAITRAVREDSAGAVVMGNGTLYGSLRRMLADNLIEAAGDLVDEDDTRRKYYRLTERGRSLLQAEMARYIATTDVIRRYGLAPAT